MSNDKESDTDLTGTILFIILIILSVVAFFLSAYNGRKANNKLYTDACSYLEKENYNKVIEIISKIHNFEHYRDAATLYEKALTGQEYKEAVLFFKSQDYNSAKEIFMKLDDYKDSELYLARINVHLAMDYQETVYKNVYDLYKKGCYDEAIEDFKLLKGYRNSSELFEKCEKLIN